MTKHNFLKMKQLVVICLHGVLLLQSLISIQEIPVADEFDVTVQSYEHLALWQECWKEGNCVHGDEGEELVVNVLSLPDLAS